MKAYQAKRRAGWAMAVFMAALCSAALGPAPRAQAGEEGSTMVGHRVELTLGEAIEAALAGNLAIKASELSIPAAFADVTAAKGEFDPALSIEAGEAARKRASVSALTGTDERSFVAQLGIGGKLTTGTGYELVWQTGRQRSDMEFLTMNPFYTSELTLSLTQPMLKGFGPDVQRTKIKVAKNSLDISRLMHGETVIEVVSGVAKAYWELYYARDYREVAALSLKLAESLLEEVGAKIVAGVLPPVERHKAESVVATRQKELLYAQKAVADGEDALRALMGAGFGHGGHGGPCDCGRNEEGQYQKNHKENYGHHGVGEAGGAGVPDGDGVPDGAGVPDGTEPLTGAPDGAGVPDGAGAPDGAEPLTGVPDGAGGTGVTVWDTVIIPVDEPPLEIRLQAPGEALAEAFANRKDLKEALIGLDSKSALTMYYRNQKAPSLDLIASMGLDGLDGDYSGAIEELGSGDHYSWEVGVAFTVPIGNRAARGAYLRAKYEEKVSVLAALELKRDIGVEVREAWRGLSVAADSILTAEKARIAAEKAMMAEEERFRVGMATLNDVLEAQRGYASVLSAEKRARVDLAIAEVELQRVKGTLLENSVTMVTGDE